MEAHLHWRRARQTVRSAAHCVLMNCAYVDPVYPPRPIKPHLISQIFRNSPFGNGSRRLPLSKRTLDKELCTGAVNRLYNNHSIRLVHFSQIYSISAIHLISSIPPYPQHRKRKIEITHTTVSRAILHAGDPTFSFKSQLGKITSIRPRCSVPYTIDGAAGNNNSKNAVERIPAPSCQVPDEDWMDRNRSTFIR